MTTLEDIYDLTNSEVEEMGLPTPCACLETHAEYDDDESLYEVCDDCGAGRLSPPRVGGHLC